MTKKGTLDDAAGPLPTEAEAQAETQAQAQPASEDVEDKVKARREAMLRKRMKQAMDEMPMTAEEKEAEESIAEAEAEIAKGAPVPPPGTLPGEAEMEQAEEEVRSMAKAEEIIAETEERMAEAEWQKEAQKVLFRPRSEAPEARPAGPKMPMPSVVREDNGAAELRDEMARILKVPKTKDSLMAFSVYSVDRYNKRYFLVDVDGEAYRKAWEVFKQRTGGKDAIRFMEIVFHILEQDMPRLHRNVLWVPLD